MKITTRIKALTVEYLMEDGTVEEREIDVSEGSSAGFREAENIEAGQAFWIASNHPRLLLGKGMIASSMTGETPEEARDYTNTLIGLIRDGHCGVFASYDIEGTCLVK